MEIYRPISLLPALGKTATYILLQRLAEQMENPGAQFGVRCRHHTSLQVVRLVEYIKDGFNRHEYTKVVLLFFCLLFLRFY